MGIPPEEGATEVVTLQTMSVPRLLFQLLRGRFSGTLELSQPAPYEGQRTVWFQGGMPVFTDWFDERDVLGQVAVEQGTITEEDLEKALEQKTAGELLGEVLGKMGVLDADKLREALRTQCMRKLVHLFGLRSGELVARNTPHDVGKGDGLGQINVLGLILTGVSEHYDEVRATLEMGKEVQGPLKATAALGRYVGHFRFDGRDKPILQALAAGSSLDHLDGLEGVARKRAAQIVFSLWSCEMLETETAPPRDSHISTQMTAYTEAARQRASLAGREAEDVEDMLAKEKAESALEGERYAAAYDAYVRAAKANPGDGEVAAGLVWCRYQLSARNEHDAETAAREIALVLRKHPKMARSHLYRGVILEDLGRRDDALVAYKTAAGLDPRLQDALRRARALASKPVAKARKIPLLMGRTPLLLVLGAVLIGAMLLANIVIGLDW